MDRLNRPVKNYPTVRRVSNAKAQELIAAGKANAEARRQAAAKLSRDAVDAEDRKLLDSAGFLEGLFIRLFRKRIALFVKALIATANERGVVTVDRGIEIVRSSDNRLWPEGRK